MSVTVDGAIDPNTVADNLPANPGGTLTVHYDPATDVTTVSYDQIPDDALRAALAGDPA